MIQRGSYAFENELNPNGNLELNFGSGNLIHLSLNSIRNAIGSFRKGILRA